MALSVQKMEIFNKDFKELFQVGAASKVDIWLYFAIFENGLPKSPPRL